MNKTLQSHILKRTGLSLVGVLVALGIFVLNFTAIGLLVLDASVASRHGGERTQATLLASEGMEAVRSMAEDDFDNVSVGTHGIVISGGVWIFSGTEDLQDQFTRSVIVTDLGVDTKKIESTVVWNTTKARQTSVSLVGYITDWRQTNGAAGRVSVEVADAHLTSSSTQLCGITVENIGNTDVTIDKMTLWWNGEGTLDHISVASTTVFEVVPSEGVSSGTEIDILDHILSVGFVVANIDLVFGEAVSGTDFILTLNMTDGSTHHSFVEI